MSLFKNINTIINVLFINVLFYNVAICTIKTVYVDKPALNVCFDNVSIACERVIFITSPINVRSFLVC